MGLGKIEQRDKMEWIYSFSLYCFYRFWLWQRSEDYTLNLMISKSK